MATPTTDLLTSKQQLESRILSRTAAVGVIGLGYVGLPLAVEFAEAGFHVTGIDVSASKVASVNNGDSYILDVPSAELRSLTAGGRLGATADFSVIDNLDTVNICVPTPLSKSKDPDMSYIDAACSQIAKHIHPGMLVVLESTTYPGTTEEFILPMLTRSGLRVGEDFFLCFSPERVDPGNPDFQTRNIPKVVGGMTSQCGEVGLLFYRQALSNVVPVSSSKVAEMVKLLENTFRMINIGMVNEFAILCNRLSIDVWEVIDAAATKPFGFMPFYPGPGLGGHCIPIDPFYLSWKTRQNGIEARFIELAGYINAQMPALVVGKVQDALNDQSKPLRGSRVHVMGVAYKRDIDDLRESPALDVIHLLQARGAQVSYSDPHIPELHVDGIDLSTIPEEQVGSADCAVIVTNHSAFNYRQLVARAPLIVDSRNALKGFSSPKIIRL
jgi:UDP-N-acetyl-D-glucosamine dehydrogenase